jgi:negative regulator of replication initiation
MRLTINLDDDLYAMARSHAIASKTSISKAVGDLLRRKTSAGVHPKSGFPVAESNFHVDPITLLPVAKGSGPLTNEQVQRMMDDDLVRPLQIMGYSDEEIEEMLK